MLKKNIKIKHRTVNGIEIDMEKVRNQNPYTRALGNANLNARGDKLDSRGRIIRKREDMVNEHYNRKQEGIKYVSLSNFDEQILDSKTLGQKIADNTTFITPEELKTRLQTPDAPKNVQPKRNRKMTEED